MKTITKPIQENEIIPTIDGNVKISMPAKKWLEKLKMKCESQSKSNSVYEIRELNIIIKEKHDPTGHYLKKCYQLIRI